MAARAGVEPAKQQTMKMAPQPQLQSRSRDFGGSRADRSAYFARREAAKILGKVLQGDARQSATGTIKSLVYHPSVRNKKATFALVCQTLKCLSILKQVLGAAGVLTGKWKRQQELLFVTAYDILFGQKLVMTAGTVEKFLMQKETVLQIALAKLCAKEKVKHPEELLNTQATSKPRYARVNTLKTDVESAIQVLEKDHKVKKDDLLSDLLILPAGTDLHDHQLVTTGSIFLQGKASSMPAHALSPKPGWKVLDACAAPGNKTVQLSALMEGKGKIIACELNEKRVQYLEDTIKRSGAHNVEVFHGDFLNINPTDSRFSEIQAILLDPSCSGSGTAIERLDHLLPSNNSQGTSDSGTVDDERVRKLSAFQKKALSHALSFPSVERVVYSTCSIHQAENEDVVASVLHFASSKGFELVAPFPQWSRRGLPTFDGSERLLRTSSDDGMDGFFIALFVRGHNCDAENKRRQGPSRSRGGAAAMFKWKLSHWSQLTSLHKRRRKL